jgi:hypothetical protein
LIQQLVALLADAVTKISNHGTVHILNPEILIHDVNAVFESFQYRSDHFDFFVHIQIPLFLTKFKG